MRRFPKIGCDDIVNSMPLESHKSDLKMSAIVCGIRYLQIR
jgi:hypothetical protein